MPSVRSAPQRISGLPGQLQPDDDVGLFIACLSGAGVCLCRSCRRLRSF